MLCFVRHPRSFVIRRSSFVRSRVCKNLGRMTQRPCRAKNVINDIPYEYFAQAVLVAKLRKSIPVCPKHQKRFEGKSKSEANLVVNTFTPHNIRGGMHPSVAGWFGVYTRKMPRFFLSVSVSFLSEVHHSITSCTE